ncbi:MAG: hypothetical protein EXS16_08955 [Gemmataceae bacterium]|nr:hypothetical protein [Gemmataceae bacterium]
MRGILADIHMQPEVEQLVAAMQAGPLNEYWELRGLALYVLDEVRLSPDSTDLAIWTTCQAEGLVLVTNNRNEDSVDSLQAAIRTLNLPTLLPVFTIGNLNRLKKSRSYADRVVKRFLDYLLDIDSVRDTGRLYLP